MNNIMGTPYYIAPEVLTETYDEKCDIWSCGIILYVLLCGYPPFNGSTDNDILKAVKKGKYDFPKKDWDNVSKEAIDLIQHMLQYDSKDRFSAQESLNHNWFKKIERNDVKKPLLASAARNMKQFKNSRKLEQATISFIVNQVISKDERNELLNHFQNWDVNGDGVLSREELFNGYKALFGEIKALEEVVIIILLIYLGRDYEIN
jgi:calcium-dependent protein kinase